MPRLTRNTLTQLDSLSNSPSAPPGPVYKQNAIMLWYKLKDTSSVPTKKSAMAMDIHGHDLADLEAFERWTHVHMQIANVTVCMPYATPSAKRATSCASEMGNEETIVIRDEGQ